MAEFLHEVVRKRERFNYERPLWLRTAYDDLIRTMEQQYRDMQRAVEEVNDRVPA